MEHETFATLTILRLLTIALGATFLWFVARAYLKHRAPSLAILFVAIGLMTAGAVVEGFMVGILDIDIEVAHLTEAVFQLLAFSVLVWSVVSHKAIA